MSLSLLGTVDVSLFGAICLKKGKPESVRLNASVYWEESGHAYRGIRTLEDYYLRFRNRELYYRGGDEETNLIDDPRFADRIAELRALAGDYFIDIDKDDKFKWARELYR